MVTYKEIERAHERHFNLETYASLQRAKKLEKQYLRERGYKVPKTPNQIAAAVERARKSKKRPIEAPRRRRTTRRPSLRWF